MAIISDNQVEEILNRLEEIRGELPLKKAYFRRMEKMERVQASVAFKKDEGKKSATERGNAKYADQDYQDHLKVIETAEVEYLELLFERDDLVEKLQIWRTDSANHRRGNI